LSKKKDSDAENNERVQRKEEEGWWPRWEHTQLHFGVAAAVAARDNTVAAAENFMMAEGGWEKTKRET
jgi:hypothetical protein